MERDSAVAAVRGGEVEGVVARSGDGHTSPKEGVASGLGQFGADAAEEREVECQHAVAARSGDEGVIVGARTRERAPAPHEAVARLDRVVRDHRANDRQVERHHTVAAFGIGGGEGGRGRAFGIYRAVPQ